MQPAVRPLRALAPLFVALLVVACVFGWRARRERGPVAAPLSSQAPLRFAWAPGTEYVYDVDLETRQRVALGRPGVQPIEGLLRLRGQVALRCYRAEEGRFLLGVEPVALGAESVLQIAGHDEPGWKDALAGQTAYFDADARGRIESLRFQRALPESVKGALTALAESFVVTLPGDPAELWEGDEPALLGEAHSRYQRGSDGELARQHARYARLHGVASVDDASRAVVASNDAIQIDLARGVLRDLDQRETLSVPAARGADALLGAEVHVALHLARTDAFALQVPALAQLEVRAPGQLGSAGGSDRGLAQLAGAMTLAQIDTTAFAYGATGRLPSGFVVSAVAFLQLHPEQADGLLELFERPGMTATARALLVDLLASAGHPAAQGAMRAALSSEVARSDPRELGTLMQRFALVSSPTRESIDFVFHEYDRPVAKETRAAAAHALGSEVGNAARGGDHARAVAMNDRLRGDLVHARGAAEKVTLLAAVGNAGLRENVAAVRRFAKDNSPEVRAETAFALRKTDAPEARDTLVDLVADGDSSVELAALGVLADMPGSHGSATRVAEFARTGSYSGETAEALVSFAGAQRDDAAAADILRALTQRAGDPRTRSRAQVVLDQLRQ